MRTVLLVTRVCTMLLGACSPQGAVLSSLRPARAVCSAGRFYLPAPARRTALGGLPTRRTRSLVVKEVRSAACALCPLPCYNGRLGCQQHPQSQAVAASSRKGHKLEWPHSTMHASCPAVQPVLRHLSSHALPDPGSLPPHSCHLSRCHHCAGSLHGADRGRGRS